jgi:hypothetical protein
MSSRPMIFNASLTDVSGITVRSCSRGRVTSKTVV